MKNILSLLITFQFFAQSYCQQAERISIPGTRITIDKPKNVLIPKHTSTLFIDSTIEFATLEFPNVTSAIGSFDFDKLPTNDPNILQNREIEISGVKGRLIISKYSYTHQLFQCYFGDSTFGVVSQCIFKNALTTIPSRLEAIMKSMQIDRDPVIEMDDFFSFTYDKKSVFQHIPINYIVTHRFTPNGIVEDSIFKITNISCLQFPPAPSIKSSKDLMMVSGAGQLSSLEIVNVLFEGETTINGQTGYKFSAICKRNDLEFELCLLTLYDSKSSLFFSCNIINGEYKEEVYRFLTSIKMKSDGY